jgi:hypothetical protein
MQGAPLSGQRSLPKCLSHLGPCDNSKSQPDLCTRKVATWLIENLSDFSGRGISRGYSGWPQRREISPATGSSWETKTQRRRRSHASQVSGSRSLRHALPMAGAWIACASNSQTRCFIVSICRPTASWCARPMSADRSMIYEEISSDRLIARKIGRHTIVRRLDALRWLRSPPLLDPTASNGGSTEEASSHREGPERGSLP